MCRSICALGLVVYIFVCWCLFWGSQPAAGSGFLNWLRTENVTDRVGSTFPFWTPNALAGITTSAFSDVVVGVVRQSSMGAADAKSFGASHPFADSTLAANATQSEFVVHVYGSETGNLVQQYPTANDTTVPERVRGTPWDSVTVLHNIVGRGSLFDSICINSGDMPSESGVTSMCGVMVAVESFVSTTEPSLVSVAGITPVVWVQKSVPRRAFLGSPDIVTAAHIPLVPTVDANNKALEGVVPWRCGRIVDASDDNSMNTGFGDTNCEVLSPEQISQTHRGCDPPLGTIFDADAQQNVSTTVVLVWNSTVYMFHPLEFAARTLSCLDPNVDTPPPRCYDYTDLIYVSGTTNRSWIIGGFKTMTIPRPAQPPPWIFLDADPNVEERCLFFTGTADGVITLFDVGQPFDVQSPKTVGILQPPSSLNLNASSCITAIASNLVDLVYSVNTSEYGASSTASMDGIFTTATTLFTTTCNEYAHFYMVSPTIGYMQQATASLGISPFVIQYAGSVVVPYPEAPLLNYTHGSLALKYPQRTPTVTITRINSVVSSDAVLGSLDQSTYNALATSSLYTVSLAVPSVGYRNQSTWAKVNNKTYGDELDSYVSVVTAISTYVPGFEATIGRVEDTSDDTVFPSTFTVADSIHTQTYYAFVDIVSDDTIVALLDPNDYYVSSNASQEFCQYGPCELAVPIRERITAVIGFIQEQELPVIDYQTSLAAQVVVRPYGNSSCPPSASALRSVASSAHRALLNASAFWLLNEATALSIISLMTAIAMNVTTGNRVQFKVVDVLLNEFAGNITTNLTNGADYRHIPLGTVSISGGTSFVQRAGLIDPYDGIVGDPAPGAISDMWLAEALSSETLNKIYNGELTAADLFPVQSPVLSAQAVAVESFRDAIKSSVRDSDILQPQNALTRFVHELRIMATLPRTTFFPTASNNGTISSDLPVLTSCVYQLSDNGVSSITSLAANAEYFLSQMGSNLPLRRSLYNATSFPSAPPNNINRAAALQIMLGSARLGSRRLNTQTVFKIIMGTPNPNDPSCGEVEETIYVSITYGAISLVPSPPSVTSGRTVSSRLVVGPDVEGVSTQTVASMYIDVGGVVAITQSYCFQTTVNVDVPLTTSTCGNGSSLQIHTRLSSTVTGLLVGQQSVCTSQLLPDNTTHTGTVGSIGVAYSAKAIVGASPITLLQPYMNPEYQFQWSAGDRHRSQVSGGNVTDMQMPPDSDGFLVVCIGANVIVFNEHAASSTIYSLIGSDGPCPPDEATCTCLQNSIHVSPDATIVAIIVMYQAINSTYGEPESLLAFFSLSDLTPLGWATPQTIRNQMRKECPTPMYPEPPIGLLMLNELPLSLLQEAILALAGSATATMSAATVMNASDVVMGAIAVVPNTRCFIVWVMARNQLRNEGRSPNVTIQTFVFASMTTDILFKGYISAVTGSPFVSFPQMTPEFNCTGCTPQTMFSVSMESLVNAIVGAYQPVWAAGGAVGRRYEYPFGIVPTLVNSSILSTFVFGQYRVGIQGIPATGANQDTSGCTFNSHACTANFSHMFVLVSDLYSDATTPPLYEIDLIACHTVPRYPNISSQLLLHPPFDNTCKLLHNETRRNVIFSNPLQGVTSFEVLSDSMCIVFGSVVCFRVTPVPMVTSVVLGLADDDEGISYTLDYFHSTPEVSFSGIVVFNPPTHPIISLAYPLDGSVPGVAWRAPWWPEMASGVVVGADFTQCANLALSDSVLTLMCASSSGVMRMAIIDAIGGQVLAASGPYGSLNSYPFISRDGRYIVYINNLLAMSVTFLNVRYATRPLVVTSTMCTFVNNLSYSVFMTAPSLSSPNGSAAIVASSPVPGVVVPSNKLPRAMGALRLVFFRSTIGNNFQLSPADSTELFNGFLPDTNTSSFAYTLQIVGNKVVLIQTPVSPSALLSAEPSPRYVGSVMEQSFASSTTAFRNNLSTAESYRIGDITDDYTAPPAYLYAVKNCFMCIVLPTFSPTPQVGQCPSICTVDATNGTQYRYTAHQNTMTRQVKPLGNTSFSTIDAQGTDVLTFYEPTDPNVTITGSQFVYTLRETQDIVPCFEGQSSATKIVAAPATYCLEVLPQENKYRDVVSVTVDPADNLIVVGRGLTSQGTAAGLTTNLEYTSKRPLFTVETHASLLHPLVKSTAVQVIPGESADAYVAMESATLADSLLTILYSSQLKVLTDCNRSLNPFAPDMNWCDATPLQVGEIGGGGDLPSPSSKYLSVEWSGSSTSLWGTGYVRVRHPLPLTYLLHRVPSMNNEERNMPISPLEMSYSSNAGSANQWSAQDATSCFALPVGAAPYGDNITVGDVPLNQTILDTPTVVCPAGCSPNYLSCGSMARHYIDAYLYHITQITGEPRVLPTSALNTQCWNEMPDVGKLMAVTGYFQQNLTPLSDWEFGRVAQIEIYCTEGGQVAVTATVPFPDASGLQYTYTNARQRVLLKLMASSDYDAALGIGFTCTHCMYFMLEGVSAQPFLVMLVGSVKGLLVCYLFYFVGRLAERKKRRRMTYVITRGDLLERLEAVKWILGMRREELRQRRGRKESGPSELEEMSSVLRERERRATNDGLFSMTTAELVAEKRHIRLSIEGVEAAYNGTHEHVGHLSRFLNRVVPNPIDLAIFLLLRLLSFKKHEDVVRVRKVIARTFSSATLSRAELAAHLGVVLSGAHCHHNSPHPQLHITVPSTPTRATPPNSQLIEGLLDKSSGRLSNGAYDDKRWYAFARYFAEHLTSDEHVWLVKHTLDTPPPLQSEKAILLQNAELRHTHLLLNAVFVTYSALMERVSNAAPAAAGLSVMSRRRNTSHSVGGISSGDTKTDRSAGVSVEAAVAFFRQEVTGYAKEWAQLGCLAGTQQSSTHFRRQLGVVGERLNEPLPNLGFGQLLYDDDSDFSDAEELRNGADANAGLRSALSVLEQRLRFQMDTLLLLRAHKGDVTFAVEEAPDAPRITKVRFASHIEESYIPAAQSDEDANPNTEAPLTSSNFVKSVHIFQSKMRDDGDELTSAVAAPHPPPPGMSLQEAADTDSEVVSIAVKAAVHVEKALHKDVDVDLAEQIVSTEHDAHFSSMSTADIVLQMLRFSHEFNARIEERQAHFDYSKMYTQQLDEALAPNAFLVLFGIFSALASVMVYSVEVLSKAASEKDKYTTFEVYQCIFFRFVNTTTFPTLLVDIFARADQIARSPSADEEEGFFGKLIPLKLGGAKKKRGLVDRAARRTFTHRARSIASDKLLLLTLILFSPPLITHVLPGCVMYAWLLITPVVLFFGLESWISTRLEALDATFVASLQAPTNRGDYESEASNRSYSEDGNDLPPQFDIVTADDVFMPVLRNMEAEEANFGMFTRMRRSLDPTTTIFIVRSLLRVVLIFLLMVAISASYTYMSVYVYAGSPLVAQPPDKGIYGNLYGGVTTYERTGSYSATSYLGAIVTDFTGRSIECTLEGILKELPVMVQTGLFSLF